MMVLIGFTSLVISCGSSNSPTSSATATPTSTPQYSSGPTTVVGTGIYQPYGIAFDSFSGSGGNFWFVGNSNPGTIYSYTPAGALVTSTDDYHLTSTYDFPSHVRADPSGYLYVSDEYNNQIEILTSAGAYVGLGPTVTMPLDTAVNAAGTTLYVMESTTPNITFLTYSITGTGYPKTYTPILNNFPNGGGALDPPRSTSMVLDPNGNVYSTDFNGTEIIKFGPTGASPVTFIPAANQPWGMVFDSSGNLFITEQTSPCFIQEYSSTGSAGVSIGFSTHTNLTDLTIDGSGNLYVSDSYNNSIYKIAK
jgi:hypothetical protein